MAAEPVHHGNAPMEAPGPGDVAHVHHDVVITGSHDQPASSLALGAAAADPAAAAAPDASAAGKFGKLSAHEHEAHAGSTGRKYYDSADRKIDGVLPPPSSPKQKTSSIKTSLLLVEDVTVSQRVARAALMKAKFRVDLAMDGKNAVDKFQKGDYDVVLMDIQLPTMNGVEATIKIREFEQKTSRSPTIIFGLTGTMTDDALKTYKEAGMNGCIGKGNVLTEAVKEAIAQYDADPTKFIVAKVEHS